MLCPSDGNPRGRRRSRLARGQKPARNPTQTAALPPCCASPGIPEPGSSDARGLGRLRPSCCSGSNIGGATGGRGLPRSFSHCLIAASPPPWNIRNWSAPGCATLYASLTFGSMLVQTKEVWHPIIAFRNSICSSGVLVGNSKYAISSTLNPLSASSGIQLGKPYFALRFANVSAWALA